jgi:hypothetical protein
MLVFSDRNRSLKSLLADAEGEQSPLPLDHLAATEIYCSNQMRG